MNGNHAMKVAILSSGVPHPTRGASTVLIFHYIAALRSAGHNLFHAILSDSPAPQIETVNAYRTALRPSDESRIEVFPGPPVFEASRFAVKTNEAKFERLRPAIADFAPDAIVCFDLEAAAAAAPLKAALKTVWLGDLNFRSMWYNYLYGFREAPLTLRWYPYAFQQMRAWRRIYAASLASFDPIIVSSHSSEADLARIGLRATYRPYPWPVPESVPTTPTSQPDLPTFLFFGNLTGLGSRSAFHFMFREVIPQLRKTWPGGGFRILIAGRAELRGWVAERMAATPEIEFLGFVDDLAGLIGRCHAVLAPLDVPVGNRSRILTAMALGGLVIAHENAALGNSSLRDGENALLFGDADRMVEHMTASVRDPARFRSVIAAAQHTYRNEFAPEAAAGAFADIVAAARPSASAAA